MAPAQVIETKDLPPELLDGSVTGGLEVAAPVVSAQPVAVASPSLPAEGLGGVAVASAGFEAARSPSESLVAPAALAGSVAEPVMSLPASVGSWLNDLQREARERLNAGQTDVWDALTRQFEAQLIHTALELTRGRRIEAAQKLGIGRNTITRKIQELGIDD